MNTETILIVEDEVLIAEHIKDLLLGFGLQEIYLAHSYPLALAAIEKLNPSIVLLDIHLKLPTEGIELAKLLDEKGGIPYIFISANVDLLIIQEATHTHAAAYITKPIKKSDLFAAIQIAMKSNSQKKESFLIVKDSYSNVQINRNDIMYIEGSGNYINIFTLNQKLVIRRSLDWIEAELPNLSFIRIHRSFIINTNHVQRISQKSVFINEIEIPVSRTYHGRITEYLNKHS